MSDPEEQSWIRWWLSSFGEEERYAAKWAATITAGAVLATFVAWIVWGTLGLSIAGLAMSGAAIVLGVVTAASD